MILVTFGVWIVWTVIFSLATFIGYAVLGGDIEHYKVALLSLIGVPFGMILWHSRDWFFAIKG